MNKNVGYASSVLGFFGKEYVGNVLHVLDQQSANLAPRGPRIHLQNNPSASRFANLRPVTESG